MLIMIGVTVLGMAICSAGIGKVAQSDDWLSFPGIAGSVLGVAALGLVALRIANIDMALVHTDGDAIKLLLVVVFVKVAIALIFLGRTSQI